MDQRLERIAIGQCHYKAWLAGMVLVDAGNQTVAQAGDQLRGRRGGRRLFDGIPEVLEVYRMSGDLDYLLKAVVSDMAGYDRLYKKLIEADLFDVSSSFVMETMKQTTALPLDSIRR